MYKALHLPSGQEIISLDPRWKSQVTYLRSLDQCNALVCPGCQQPVRLRAGKIKRWHFAHMHLQNCPFERESPALLSARAVLYHRLIETFEVENVTVEKNPEISDLPRAIDCWVENDDLHLAYWIFDRRMPPNERKHLKLSVEKLGVPIQWIFITELLHEDSELASNRLCLTTTERAFLQMSAFDQAWQTHFEQLGKSLHYLDTEQETLITYRNLNVIHAPQVYAGTRLVHPLREILVDTDNGEFIHPGETERLQKRRSEIEAQAEAAALRLQKAQDFFRRGSLANAGTPFLKNKPGNQPYERLGTCRICGKQTTDWITYFGQTKECICRECNDRIQDRD